MATGIGSVSGTWSTIDVVRGRLVRSRLGEAASRRALFTPAGDRSGCSSRIVAATPVAIDVAWNVPLMTAVTSRPEDADSMYVPGDHMSTQGP